MSERKSNSPPYGPPQDRSDQGRSDQGRSDQGRSQWMRSVPSTEASSHPARWNSIAVLAAEIAGPANSLLALTTNLTEKQRIEVRRLANRSANLLWRIRTIEDLERANTGDFKISRSRTDLTRLVRGVCQRFESVARRGDVQFQIQAASDIVANVDVAGIEQILIELLVEAFHIAGESGTVDCVLGGTGSEAEIAVEARRDASAGVGDAHWREPGPGLELAANIAQLHEGRVARGDREGGGAAFRVFLPLLVPDSELDPPEAWQMQTEPMRLQGAIEDVHPEPVSNAIDNSEWPDEPVVLVVGHDPAATAGMREALAGEFRTVSAADSRDGLEKALELRPDLILADLNSPTLAGGEIVSAIRRHRELDDIPIIVFCGDNDRSRRVGLYGDGVQDFVSSPISAEEVRVRVRNQIMMKRTRAILEDDLSLTSATLEDLTRRATLQKREFELSSRLRDEFVATLNHDLRTPLTSIHGWVCLMQTRQMDQSMRSQALVSIERNVNALTSSVEELLDLSRIVTGKADLEVNFVELAPILGEVVDSMRMGAETRDIAIQTRFDPASPMVLGDIDRLRQVFTHLIGNAVKFARQGGTVDVRLEPFRAQVQVVISDDGEGIGPDFLPHVFDHFRQADASTRRSHHGLGLGLAIVKALVELHGGTIEAKSGGIGRGTTFTMRLPVLGGAARVESDESFQFPNTSGDLQGRRVLLVEDDADTRAFLTILLEQSHAKVSAYSAADAALDAFRERPPDVLICDIGLPKKDGYDFVREVRQMERGSPVPAIALTAYTTPEDRDRAIEAGFQIHISKPVDPSRLITAVREITEGK